MCIRRRERKQQRVKSNKDKAKDVTKYGGITSIANSGYTLVEYTVKGKNVKSLEALPVYLGKSETLSNEKILEYITGALQKECTTNGRS